MSVKAIGSGPLARGETQRIDVDWGENTSGSETGVLKAGDTIASAAITTQSKPGADSLTFGSVSVNNTAVYINGRSCSAGEATTCTVTAGSSQTYGVYLCRITATTTNGLVIPRDLEVVVEE